MDITNSSVCNVIPSVTPIKKMKRSTHFGEETSVTESRPLVSQCHQLFHSLQDLVDHINDFHVKPEKDSGYCCQWEGCVRNGRGFNARYVDTVTHPIISNVNIVLGKV